ncbi:methyl-accepting chemotaxis protein [Ammoniphilus sp. YIM 78166]|uniref:methyl-accepting chemotaxis protein n=1 Tax=Ammoniphilus sp. YIM 78166 TaxID=1644106 RepID=UPI00106FB6AF|nr:methyl-accepting chemotaxis protein [Ammoniphilus sp. YIM 78166]
MFRKGQLKIGTKIMIWFLVIALLPLLFSSYVIYTISSTELLEKQKVSLVDLASSTTKGMDQWLERRLSEVQLAAQTEIVQSLDAQRQLELFQTIKKQTDIYETVVFTGVDGIVKAHTTVENMGVMNLADREYFKRGMEGQSTYSEILVSKATGNRIVVVATPVKDYNDRIVGVMSASMNFEALLNTFLQEQSIQNDSHYPILVDESDRLQMIPQQELLGKKVGESELPQGLQEILLSKDRSGVSIYKDQEQQYVVAYSPIQQTGYQLYLHVPIESILSSATKIKNSVMGIGLAAAIMVILAAWAIAHNLSKLIKKIAEQARRVAEGDLTVQHLEVKNKDELGQLAQDFDRMSNSLKQLIRQVANNTEQVAASAEELTASAEQTSKATEHIASAMQQVAVGSDDQVRSVEDGSAAMNEMADRIVEMENTAKMVSNTATRTSHQALEGGQAIERAVHQMNSIHLTVNGLAQVVKGLGLRSQEIGQITEAITGIAAQTNLLALNATIEAARAGEHGRGFAVVADEVRKLAEQSGQSAQQISQLIMFIQNETTKAMNTMENAMTEVGEGIRVVHLAGSSFDQIQGSIDEVAEQIQEVSKAVQQISRGSEMVVHSIHLIAQVAEETSSGTQTVSASAQEQLASIEEITASASALAHMAEELQLLIGKFKV